MSSTALVTEAVTAQRPNRYAGTCISCGKRVEAEAGFLVRTVEGKSAVICGRDLIDVATKYQVTIPAPSALRTLLGDLDEPDFGAYLRADEMAAMAEREYFDERSSGRTTLADAHSQWHAVNGQYAICDLDCGATEGLMDEDAEWSEPEETDGEPVEPVNFVSDAVAYSYVDRQDLVPFRPRRGVAPEPVALPAHYVSLKADNGQVYYGLGAGTYTLETAEGHRTFRIRVQRTDAKFAPGQTVIEYLSGSDNTGDYTSFGFVSGSVLKPWKRFADRDTLLAEAREFLAHPENATAARNCIRCNALLTTPESLALGMGPTCKNKGW